MSHVLAIGYYFLVQPIEYKKDRSCNSGSDRAEQRGRKVKRGRESEAFRLS